MRFLCLFVISLALVSCAAPKKEKKELQPVFVFLASDTGDIAFSENFPERLSSQLKDSYDGRVLLLSPVEKIKVKSEVARVEKVINKLRTKGYTKIFLVGFKTGTVVGCQLLERGAPVTGFVGIDIENEYPGANCIRSLANRRGVKVLDIYTQREELNFRQANLRTQFLHDRYEQRVAFGTGSQFRRGEGKIVKLIRNWVR